MVRAAAGKISAPSPAGSLQEVFEQCRRLGMRLSRQRRMVLDLLWSEKSHLSARDIFEQLNLRGRSIGHTSVYQNLEALQSAGVIECLDRASGRCTATGAIPTVIWLAWTAVRSKTSMLFSPTTCCVRSRSALGFGSSRTPCN